MIAPNGPSEPRYSRPVNAAGKTSVAATPRNRGAISRSATYGTVANPPTSTATT